MNQTTLLQSEIHDIKNDIPPETKNITFFIPEQIIVGDKTIVMPYRSEYFMNFKMFVMPSINLVSYDHGSVNEGGIFMEIKKRIEDSIILKLEYKDGKNLQLYLKDNRIRTQLFSF